MSKSRPVYAPFALDYAGARHLVVTEQPDPPAGLDISLAEITVFSLKTIAPGVPAPASAQHRSFRAKAELLGYLGPYLARETMGLRLYAIGSEAFCWDIHNLAASAGLGSSEIHLTRAGALTRRVYCTHCKTLIEGAALNVTPCPGCGASLFVRDHFSRQMGAFMGVKIDAEVPGEAFVAEGFGS
jgi:predicted RNA-binding Zn-ribbon protein involved in translation (DUF1610 family)